MKSEWGIDDHTFVNLAELSERGSVGPRQHSNVTEVYEDAWL